MVYGLPPQCDTAPVQDWAWTRFAKLLLGRIYLGHPELRFGTRGKSYFNYIIKHVIYA